MHFRRRGNLDSVQSLHSQLSFKYDSKINLVSSSSDKFLIEFEFFLYSTLQSPEGFCDIFKTH